MDRYLKGFNENFIMIELDIYMEIGKLKASKQLYPGSKIISA